MHVGDTNYYLLKTGHGSELLVIFRFTGYYDQSNHGETFPSGDLVVQGTAKSIGKKVGLMGLGFLPEIGSHIAVTETGKDKDGLSHFDRELIVSIEELTEEQYEKSQSTWFHQENGGLGKETTEDRAQEIGEAIETG